MSQELTYRVEEDGELFVAKCLDIEIDSDGLTREEALLNLQEALALHFGNEDIVLVEERQAQK